VGFNSHELELTDGWYGVRTAIDEHLNYQIFAGKIKIGTKLITCGAELMNCDGCHPLDVTDLTFLKICFNCTRRTKWDVKLGYQRFPGPFSVPIHSVRPGGGPIGRIDVFVVRSYPFRYLDKSEVKCGKSEERRAQAWENERYKKLELIEENIRNEFRSISNPEKLNNNCDISGITCPRTLLEIIENSNDPEMMEVSHLRLR
uniref:Breast cancer type 2 susceptibility protein homolog n=1 Tax=Diabrotica virgifera virgifera TaxID=50390 RepID=A0A6P7GXJ0_DIAVI